MLAEFVNSVLVGICAAAPLGPVAALVIQKTLCYGRRAGFVTGCGSALVDVLYSVIGVFALGLVQRLIDRYTLFIEIAGGATVAAVGLFMALRNPFRGMQRRGQASSRMSASFPIQGLVFSLANPGALILMLGLLAIFNTGGDKLLTLCGVAVGTVLWWFVFTWGVSKFRRFFNMNTLVLINRIIGIAVAIFGSIWIARAFLVIG